MTYTPEQKAARRAIKGVTPDTDLAGNPLTEAQKATMRETEARWAKEDAAKAHPLAALIAGVKVKDFDVEIVRGNSGGNLALYFNDYRVSGSKPWGGGTTIHKFRVQGDDAKASGILATIRDFQNVPVVKECLTTDAALEAATPPDHLVWEAGKVLEGVTVQVWNADGCRVEAFRGKDQDGADYWEAVAECENEQDARFIAWCREGVPSLIALATAQAAQIAGLTKERNDYAMKWHVACDEAVKQEVRAEAAETALAAERAKVAKLVEALKPFAEYMADGGDKNYEGDLLPDTEGMGWVYLTVGDFRRAIAAITEAGQ